MKPGAGGSLGLLVWGLALLAPGCATITGRMADETRKQAATDLRCQGDRIHLTRETPDRGLDDSGETRPPPGTPFVRYVFTARGCGRSERYLCRFTGCEPGEPRRECGSGEVSCRRE